MEHAGFAAALDKGNNRVLGLRALALDVGTAATLLGDAGR
jgi:hypothetical protein